MKGDRSQIEEQIQALLKDRRDRNAIYTEDQWVKAVLRNKKDKWEEESIDDTDVINATQSPEAREKRPGVCYLDKSKMKEQLSPEHQPVFGYVPVDLDTQRSNEQTEEERSDELWCCVSQLILKPEQDESNQTTRNIIRDIFDANRAFRSHQHNVQLAFSYGLKLKKGGVPDERELKRAAQLGYLCKSNYDPNSSDLSSVYTRRRGIRFRNAVVKLTGKNSPKESNPLSGKTSSNSIRTMIKRHESGKSQFCIDRPQSLSVLSGDKRSEGSADKTHQKPARRMTSFKNLGFSSQQLNKRSGSSLQQSRNVRINTENRSQFESGINSGAQAVKKGMLDTVYEKPQKIKKIDEDLVGGYKITYQHSIDTKFHRLLNKYNIKQSKHMHFLEPDHEEPDIKLLWKKYIKSGKEYLETPPSDSSEEEVKAKPAQTSIHQVQPAKPDVLRAIRHRNFNQQNSMVVENQVLQKQLSFKEIVERPATLLKEEHTSGEGEPIFLQPQRTNSGEPKVQMFQKRSDKLSSPNSQEIDRQSHEVKRSPSFRLRGSTEVRLKRDAMDIMTDQHDVKLTYQHSEEKAASSPRDDWGGRVKPKLVISNSNEDNKHSHTRVVSYDERVSTTSASKSVPLTQQSAHVRKKSDMVARLRQNILETHRNKVLSVPGKRTVASTNESSIKCHDLGVNTTLSQHKQPNVRKKETKTPGFTPAGSSLDQRRERKSEVRVRKRGKRVQSLKNNMLSPSSLFQKRILKYSDDITNTTSPSFHKAFSSIQTADHLNKLYQRIDSGMAQTVRKVRQQYTGQLEHGNLGVNLTLQPDFFDSLTGSELSVRLQNQQYLAVSPRETF